MKQFTYEVRDELGLHARVATELVNRLQDSESNVTLQDGSKTADAKKMFSLMALCVQQGDMLTFTIEGGDEEALSRELRDFCRKYL